MIRRCTILHSLEDVFTGTEILKSDLTHIRQDSTPSPMFKQQIQINLSGQLRYVNLKIQNYTATSLCHLMDVACPTATFILHFLGSYRWLTGIFYDPLLTETITTGHRGDMEERYDIQTPKVTYDYSDYSEKR